jgi:integrase
MPIYFDKAKQRFRFEYSRVLEGRRHRATKLLPATWTRDQAEAYGQEQDAKLYAIATGATKQDPLISEAVLLYIKERLPKLKSQAITERELANCASAYVGRRMNELAAVANEYATEQANLLSPATIRNRMAYVRAACRWAWKHKNMGTDDPAIRMVLPPVSNERHVYITEAQIRAVAKLIDNTEARAVALVAFYSGMRLSEILRAVPTKQGWVLADTKNGAPRIIPIHPKVRSLVKMWPVSVAARTVQGCWDRARAPCGLGHVHFHDVRHSAASAMVNAGADLYAVGGVLGHKSFASTQRYAHLATERLDTVVKMIGKKKA